MTCAAGFGAAKASRGADASVSGRTPLSGKAGGGGGAAQRLEGLHASLNAKDSHSTSPTAGKLRRQAPLSISLAAQNASDSVNFTGGIKFVCQTSL